MANTITDRPVPTLDTGYLSLQEFQDRYQQATRSPYRSKFSIARMIGEWQAKHTSLPDGSLAQTIAHLEAIEAQLQNKNEDWKSICKQEAVDVLMTHIFPSFFYHGQMGFINQPFENQAFRYQTEALLNLFTNDRLEVKVNPQKFMNTERQQILKAGAIILNTFYDQEVDIHVSDGMVLRDRELKMEKHYTFNIHLDYLDVEAVKPLKKLSKKQIHDLLNNLDDKQLWLEHIPPENFLFKGFVVGLLSDVTRAEVLSTLKEKAANEASKSDHEDELDYLEILVRSYLNMPEVKLGILQTAPGPWLESLTWCLLRKYDTPMMSRTLEDSASAYGKVLHCGQAVIIEDLREQAHLSPLEQALAEQGLTSLLLAPLKDDEGKVISIFELASAEPYRFNQLTLLQLGAFISQVEMGSNKFLHEMDNAIRLTIQQEFTSIHPSVEWKFRQVASKYYWDRKIELKQSIPDPIVFKDVYPLYGQADIVGSSKLRNQSIQTDLTDNLQRLYRLLVACREAAHFHLLDIYADKVKAHLEKLQHDGIVSSDESVIVELLTQQIHPLLRQLRLRFPQLPQELLDDYFDNLDAELDIVYRSRKDYEDSVNLLNQTISHYLLQEEEKMQEVLPHYFEKFQTDGVEYNLYLGQSLLREGEFHSFYLRDFRLWQLIMMCEMTRLVEQQAREFPMPLQTAQLIFVYSSSLSIRFEMDEKQFAVDGTYNVRYEILKKRIDKAYVKGTDERLTQAGKIAIVWLQEKDRQEYQEYLDHLVRNGYISPQIEDLELEKMQGVEGLKAIRVEVIGKA